MIDPARIALVARATLVFACLAVLPAFATPTLAPAIEYGALGDHHGKVLAAALDPRNTPSTVAVTDDGAVWFREMFSWHPRIARFGADGSFREFADPYVGNSLHGPPPPSPCELAPSCLISESWSFTPLVAAGDDVMLGPLHVHPGRMLVLSPTGDLSYRSAEGCLTAGPDLACFPNSHVDIVFRERYASFRSGPRTAIAPNSAVLGPDGNMWFTDADDSLIGRVHPDGTYDTFTAGLTRWDSGPQFITVGPDGNLWFTEQRDRIGRVTPSGDITEFSAGIPRRSSIGGIAPGPDGALWFTLFHGMVLARITTAGVVTQYHDLVYPSDGHDFDPVAMIARDREGRLYYNEGQAGRIARVTIPR